MVSDHGVEINLLASPQFEMHKDRQSLDKTNGQINSSTTPLAL